MASQRTGKVLYIRDVPVELSRRLKVAAILHGDSLQQYLVKLLSAHVADLERNGTLPKAKR